MGPRVVAVSRRARHAPGKEPVGAIRLIAGIGVEGDAHAGETVQHVYDQRRDPTRPNLRQVHLIGAELHEELRDQGYEVGPGELGENVTTAGLDLPALPAGTRLRLGDDALVELTGLRSPCRTLDKVRPGLMKATLGRNGSGRAMLRGAVMAVVVAGGEVGPGAAIAVEEPAAGQRALEPV